MFFCCCWFFFFFQKTKNVFFDSVPCYFGVSRSSNWMLQQAIFHHHNFWFSVKKNGVQQTLFATDWHYSLCPKLASSPFQAQCLKMKISFISAPRADIRLHCGVVPAYWCDKCSSPLLLIRTESATCSNTVKERAYLKVHSPYTDFHIAKQRQWEEKNGSNSHMKLQSTLILQLSSLISQIMTMSEIPPHA